MVKLKKIKKGDLIAGILLVIFGTIAVILTVIRIVIL